MWFKTQFLVNHVLETRSNIAIKWCDFFATQPVMQEIHHVEAVKRPSNLLPSNIP